VWWGAKHFMSVHTHCLMCVAITELMPITVIDDFVQRIIVLWTRPVPAATCGCNINFKFLVRHCSVRNENISRHLFPLIPYLVWKLKFTTNIPNYFYWFLICLSLWPWGPPSLVLLGTKCNFIGGKVAEAWGWPLPYMLRLRISGTVRRLSTNVSLTWAGSDLCFWFLCKWQ